jgi:hypothetical protein
MAQDKTGKETMPAVALEAVRVYRVKFESEPTHVQVNLAALAEVQGLVLPGIVVEGSHYVQPHCALAGVAVKAEAGALS